jgi:hypothetical protein
MQPLRPLLMMAFSLCVCAAWAPGFAEAAQISRLNIAIQVDSKKHDNLQWDHVPTGFAPDPMGSVVAGGQKQEIPVQENTFLVTTAFYNVQLDAGAAIMFDIVDRDRGRVDDVIARGSINWNGEPTSTYRLGLATITVNASLEAKENVLSPAQPLRQ